MIPRVHIPNLPTVATPLIPDAGIYRYLVRVLRLRAGDGLVVFDGQGGEWEAHLTSVAPPGEIRLFRHHPCHRESPLAITLVHGLAKGEAMTMAIQKAVELGVTALAPVLAQRSVARPEGRNDLERQARWQRIAVEAAEQCGRTRIPVLFPLATWNTLAANLPNGLRLIFWEEAATEQRLRSVLSAWHPPEPITVLIGPEGGWTPEEVNLAKERLGCVVVSLGPRILRTETAVITVLTALQVLLGDMG